MTREGIEVGHTDQGYVSLVINDGESASSIGLTPKRALQLASSIQSEAGAAHRELPRDPLPAFDGEPQTVVEE